VNPRTVALSLGALAMGGQGPACAPRPGPSGGPLADSPVPARARPSIEGARELDQQGVKAFGEGRFADAAVLFRSARALGGPASESWNLARCLERLDDAEGAAGAIDLYLASRDLGPQDRADAERESRALRARPSWLTVTTTPAGASVAVDGQTTAGPTPTSLEVRPGTHTVVVKRAGYTPESRIVDARFGRAIVVALDLEMGRK
jgi:hypothetical protein